MKATFKNFVDRVVKYDKSKLIYKNGAENNYSELMEAVRCNSVTASMASEIMVQYIIGKGFGEFDNFEFDGLKVHEFAEDIAQDLVDNKAVFIGVDYDSNCEIAGYKVLPFGSCRIGKKDSRDYSGKILYSKDWSDSKIKPEVIDVFNPKLEIVNAQIKRDGGIEKYKGQILYYTTDRRRIYPLCRIHPVAKECDNEDLASSYKNTVARRGFFGKTLVITKPLIDDELHNDDSPEGLRMLRDAESERAKFKSTIEDFVGAENAGGVMHVELEFESDNLEDSILFKNIESNINPDMFKTLEDSACIKILMVYKNLPISLVKSPDSAMFGNSGESIYEAQLMYQKNTEKERNILETLVNDLWKMHRDFDKTYKQIIPLIDEKVTDTE